MDSRRFVPSLAFAAALALKPDATAELPVDLTAVQSLPPQELRSMMSEASAIWRPLGVTLTWVVTSGLPGTEHILEVVNDRGLGARGVDKDGTARDGRRPAHATPRLGAVVFLDGNVTPERTLAVSIDAVRRMVEDTPLANRRVADWPPAFREALVGRALGRVLAHEIGHCLLAWRGHTPDGLMRAAFQGDRLINPDRRPFALSKDLMPRLHGRLAQLSGPPATLAAVD